MMRILMLTWEFPPQIVGGLGRAVADLSQSLAKAGHDVHVLTGENSHIPREETYRGVTVHRVSVPHPEPLNFLDSVLYLNFQLIEKAIQLHLSGWQWDVVHAHDWLVAHSAKVLKHSFEKPMVATIHATESGRNDGIHNDLQNHINQVEWWLTYEAYQVIVCSDHMKDELKRLFQVPEDKISILPNGVRLENFRETHKDLVNFRRQYVTDDEKLIFYIGRLVREKGLDTLLESVPQVLEKYPRSRFVIAGKGPEKERLEHKARELGVDERVSFIGFIDDPTRNSLYRVADAAVFPSYYEPFGIVALEAMAAQTPLIATDIGGFAEIVRHEENGLLTLPGNSQSLASAILRLLFDPQLARRLKQQAFQQVKERYDWDIIAEQTLDCYQLSNKRPFGDSFLPFHNIQQLPRYQETENI